MTFSIVWVRLVGHAFSCLGVVEGFEMGLDSPEGESLVDRAEVAELETSLGCAAISEHPDDEKDGRERVDIEEAGEQEPEEEAAMHGAFFHRRMRRRQWTCVYNLGFLRAGCLTLMVAYWGVAWPRACVCEGLCG